MSLPNVPNINPTVSGAVASAPTPLNSALQPAADALSPVLSGVAGTRTPKAAAFYATQPGFVTAYQNATVVTSTPASLFSPLQFLGTVQLYAFAQSGFGYINLVVIPSPGGALPQTYLNSSQNLAYSNCTGNTFQFQVGPTDPFVTVVVSNVGKLTVFTDGADQTLDLVTFAQTLNPGVQTVILGLPGQISNTLSQLNDPTDAAQNIASSGTLATAKLPASNLASKAQGALPNLPAPQIPVNAPAGPNLATADPASKLQGAGAGLQQPIADLASTGKGAASGISATIPSIKDAPSADQSTAAQSFLSTIDKAKASLPAPLK